MARRRLARVALIVLTNPRCHLVEQPGLRIRRDVLRPEIIAELAMGASVEPGAVVSAGCIPSQPVAPVVVIMGGVTFGPGPVRFVHSNQSVELDPQVGVADRAVLLPPMAA